MSQAYTGADIRTGDGWAGGRGGDVGSYNTNTVNNYYTGIDERMIGPFIEVYTVNNPFGASARMWGRLTYFSFSSDAAWLIEYNKTKERSEKALESLPHADASYRSTLNVLKSNLLEGTRTEILDELGAWAKGIDPDLSDCSIYVLSGAAGSGKSTIAYEMAKRLEKEKLLGASFFFARGSQDLSSARMVFSTIAYQLARSQRDLFPHIVEAAQDHMKQGLNQLMEFELDDLIIQPLMKVSPNHLPVILILDAVDECTDPAQDRVPRMLHLLLERLRQVPFPLRALITTRPELHIEDVFQSAESRKYAKLLKFQDIPRKVVDADIMRYLTKNITKIRYSDYLLKARPDAALDLTKRADGLFIYATTAIDLLRSDAEHAIQILDMLLSDKPGEATIGLSQLDKLYLVVLENAFPEEYLERRDGRDRIQRVLGSIALLQDHISPSTMESLVGVSVMDTRYILTRLRSVILIDRDDDEFGEIHPMHASFPQFLIDKKRCKNENFYIDPLLHHARLASACLTLLHKPGVLCENICQLPDRMVFKDSIEDLELRVKKHIPLHVQYACMYWATHLSGSTTNHTTELVDLLEAFSSKKLIIWLEVLSLMNKLDIAAPALLNARVWYQAYARTQHRDDTLKLLNDGYRFVLEYFIPINNCVEHIYISALPLTPTCRLFDVYSTPSARVHSVKVSTGRDPQWGPCLRVVEGHTGRVHSVKFSSNGRWIASASDDKTARSWDAGSGTVLNVMRGHRESVEAVDFSPDNSRIVSGSSDGTLRIWNAASGASLNRLRANHGNVFSVAYALDGTKIVSGSFDDVLHLWDARRGKKLEIMDGANCANSVDFSHDGTRIVSASSDKKIRIWNGGNGDLLKTLKGHTDQAKSAVFFPAGDKIVSGASDKTVRIWDVSTGKCLKVLKGHAGRVFCVAISPKGDTIASGSDDSTIRLWDARSGDILAVLKDHTSWVHSVCFSPDGDRLVSGSDDKTVRIWDLMEIGIPRMTTGHTSAIDCVVFSKDGALVASGSEDTTITIWDTTSGRQLRTLKGHTERVRSVMFSPDGKRIVSAGWDNKVQIWEVTSGTLWKTLVGHTKGVEAVTYSPDGKLIASGANNLEPSIRLWRASDGSLERKIEVDFQGEPFDMIEKLEFSPDSTMIYTKTINGLTYIWKCSTGELLKKSEKKWKLETKKFKEENGWIILKETGRKLCWLTGSKRAAGERASACHGDYYAVGAGSGQFTILDFSELVHKSP